MLSTLLRLSEGRTVKHIKGVAHHAGGLTHHGETLTDAELRGKADEFKSATPTGNASTTCCPGPLAVVVEATWRSAQATPAAQHLAALND